MQAKTKPICTVRALVQLNSAGPTQFVLVQLNSCSSSAAAGAPPRSRILSSVSSKRAAAGRGRNTFKGVIVIEGDEALAGAQAVIELRPVIGLG